MKKIMKAAMIFVMFVLVGWVCFMSSIVKAADNEKITAEKEQAIRENCYTIKGNLINLQHEDSKVRVYLGKYYGTILTDFITPLNVVLVGNNMSDLDLIENQNNFTVERANFVSDYVSYQKLLEELVALDCKAEPVQFYDKLQKVRVGREKVKTDVMKLQSLVNKQKALVTALKETL